MSSSEVDRIFRDSPPKERPNRAELEKQLVRFRQQGYALTSSERVAGVTAISVPLRDINGQVRYCISVTGPAIRVDRKADAFIALLLNASKVVSSQMGARADEIEDCRRSNRTETSPPQKGRGLNRTKLRRDILSLARSADFSRTACGATRQSLDSLTLSRDISAWTVAVGFCWTKPVSCFSLIRSRPK